MLTLAGKKALITGAASGIGAATASLFRALGATVTGLDKNAADDSAIIEVDITSATALKAALDSIQSAGHTFDILVNIAGGGCTGSLAETSMEDFTASLDLNLNATAALCKWVQPSMIERGHGVIINTGSTFGLTGRDNSVAYGVSKAGVIQLTKCMAVDLADTGVRVNCVCPGLIETPMTSVLFEEALVEEKRKNLSLHTLRRAGRPVEVANVIAFLASDLSSYITGASIPVDGGYTAGKWL